MSELPGAAGRATLVRASALPWLALAALAAVGWRAGVAFALSSGGAPDVEHLLFEAADNPPWLVTAIAAALLFSRRADLRDAIGAPGSLARASWLLAPGLAFLVWARLTGADDLALLGALAMALGSALALAGARLARLLAVPLGLLLFAIPVPGALVNQVVWPLQLTTSAYAYWLLDHLGVTVLHLGDVLRTPSHNFLVIEGCSGLGSMEVLTLLALAWAWQTGARFRHGLVLVLAAPAIAFVLNGFRVVGLVLFPDSNVWSVHTIQGIVTFAVGTLLIALLDRWIRGAGPEPERAPATAPGSPRVRAGVLAWVGAAALASLALPPFATREVVVGPDLLPAALPGFREGKELEPDLLFLGSVRFARSAYRTYEPDPAPAGPASVAVFVGEDAHGDRVTSVRSEKTSLPGRGWTLDERDAVALPLGYRAERVVAHTERGTLLAYRLYLGVASAGSEALRAFLALDRTPFGRRDHAYVVRLSTALEPGALGTAQAERRLQDAFRGLEPQLRRLREWRAPAPR